MLVTDGKLVDVRLTGSGLKTSYNWQAMVDQTTGTNTAVVVTDEECADGVLRAFDQSVRFLGGQLPDAILHDNKPCYDDVRLPDALAPVVLIPSTPGRGQNKALVEGAFGKWEQFVGTIELDDSSMEAMQRSAVSEIIRAYCAGADHAPREDMGGKSRIGYLREFVRSDQQRQRDAKFLRELKQRHSPGGRSPRQIDESRRLLDAAFSEIEALRDKDRKRSLRRYLSSFEPAAVRRGLALFVAKLERGAVELRSAHRYLRALIVNCQNELDLLQCENELLRLADMQRECWTQHLQTDLDRIADEVDNHTDLARRLAELAAHGGLPVEGAFWTERLCETLDTYPEINDEIRRFLARLYEAPQERRLALIDLIAARNAGLAA